MFYKARKKISGQLRINAFICILLFAVFSVGISAGSSNFNLTEENSEVIISYFSNEENFESVVSDSFSKNMKLMMWIFISGVSLIGIPAVLYLLFSEGVSMGASVCALLSVSDTHPFNIVLNLLPQIVFLIVALMLLSYYSFIFSYSLCVKVFSVKKRYAKNEASFVVLAVIFLLSALLCYFSALCEGWFIPRLN